VGRELGFVRFRSGALQRGIFRPANRAQPKSPTPNALEGFSPDQRHRSANRHPICTRSALESSIAAAQSDATLKRAATKPIPTPLPQELRSAGNDPTVGGLVYRTHCYRSPVLQRLEIVSVVCFQWVTAISSHFGVSSRKLGFSSASRDIFVVRGGGGNSHFPAAG
jgi:hypothetical protein